MACYLGSPYDVLVVLWRRDFLGPCQAVSLGRHDYSLVVRPDLGDDVLRRFAWGIA